MSPSLPLLRLFHSGALSVRPEHRTPELRRAIEACERELEEPESEHNDDAASAAEGEEREWGGEKAREAEKRLERLPETSDVFRAAAPLVKRLARNYTLTLSGGYRSGALVRRNVSERVAAGSERRGTETLGGGLSRTNTWSAARNSAPSLARAPSKSWSSTNPASLLLRLRAQRSSLSAARLPATHITFADRAAADVFWSIAAANARNGPEEVRRAVEAMRVPLEAFPNLAGLTVFFEEPERRVGGIGGRSGGSPGSAVSTKALGGIHFHVSGAEMLVLEEQSSLIPDRAVSWTVRRLYVSIADPDVDQPASPTGPKSPHDTSPLDPARRVTARALRTFDDVRTLRVSCSARGGLPWPEPPTNLFDRLRKLSELHLRGLRFPSAAHLDSFMGAVVDTAPGLEKVAVWGSPTFERRGGWDGRKVIERLPFVPIPRRSIYKLRGLRKLREVTLADHDAMEEADWFSILSAWPSLQALRLRRRIDCGGDEVDEEGNVVAVLPGADSESYTDALVAAPELLPRLRTLHLSSNSNPDARALEQLLKRCRDLRDVALVCEPEELGPALEAIIGHPKLGSFKYEVPKGTEGPRPEIVVKMVQRFGPKHLEGAGGRWDAWEEV
ncbi:hypothetical protein M427DRAFT_57473 [Gonapodya prolifera JEL478]|uniref:RNI-like protein n=1 Tax=Gonapodya prolifera (strain JEL478) TaxID=1344416 RepID=A0A139ACR5_GONPJ|nr:hypothetical protein M427DRAFT_57473 [Gonapodya prolifera JEL478]|eukprot:KXS14560.1 hypothetical protein M427DRAFT_57473 [Gonapodya prolifera JEL478]